MHISAPEENHNIITYRSLPYATSLSTLYDSIIHSPDTTEIRDLFVCLRYFTLCLLCICFVDVVCLPFTLFLHSEKLVKNYWKIILHHSKHSCWQHSRKGRSPPYSSSETLRIRRQFILCCHRQINSLGKYIQCKTKDALFTSTKGYCQPLRSWTKGAFSIESLILFFRPIPSSLQLLNFFVYYSPFVITPTKTCLKK